MRAEYPHVSRIRARIFDGRVTYAGVCQMMMGMSKKKRPRPRSRVVSMQRTREALVEAGIELFSQKGLDAPSLDEICDRAGFTRGAFYVHFEDRDAFLVAVMAEVGSRFLEGVIARVTSEDADASGGLAETARRFVGAFEAGGYPLMAAQGVRPHQLMQACARSPKIRERYVELVRAGINLVGQVVHADQGRRKVRTDIEYEEVARVLITLIAGAQTLWDIGVDVDVPRLSRSMLRMLAYG
jgi:TetR/AcrR family transcriptional regulator, transcriptional repressor for nem operon